MGIKILIIMINIILVVLTALALFIYHRNERVCAFNMVIIEAAYGNLKKWLSNIRNDNELLEKKDEYERRSNMVDIIVNKHSYGRLLFSTKSLILEKWYTEEEIKFLEEGLS